MAKLWGGRFQKGLDESAKDFSYSYESDKRMFEEDLLVNEVHTKALEKAGILSTEEANTVINALKNLKKQFETELLAKPQDDEDIHSCVERLLIETLGDLGKKVHTGKSRNDQVATDIRLYMKKEVAMIQEGLRAVNRSLWHLAETHKELIFPGFTHLQIAQPILFAHHLLAYIEKLKRDIRRFDAVMEELDVCPLGSAAMAGTNYPLDRAFMAKELGFSGLSQNSMDAVSSRDFMLSFLSATATCMAHFSQLSEELIFWSSPVVGFIEIGDDFTTGSSIMPQKKNPDMAELTRGKTGPVLGDFVALHEMIKGLPMTYNRDLQEDKPLVFHAIDTIKGVLACFEKMIPTIQLFPSEIEKALQKGFILATELADYLVLKGIPFREAHEVTGNVVQFAIQENKGLEDLTLQELQSFSDRIDESVRTVLTLDSAINRKNVIGGTSREQVSQQLSKIKEEFGC
ncbi:argininosuccinate lyase [Candidatus Marinamargulisbacteria bacterium SCGC AG-439-L15]|nr:argininosuccinate lyase [Candidatus Marinamargulisbacteria bacterium SCGC AG-439-L15]